MNRCYWCESNVSVTHFGFTYTDDCTDTITDRMVRTYYHNACRYVHGTRTNPTPPRPANNPYHTDNFGIPTENIYGIPTITTPSRTHRGHKTY